MTDWTISEKEDDTPAPVAGERLAEARRAADIPVRDVAKELHLDEPKVRALEENRFDDLGAAVFAKGHLRKYADLVGVSADDVMSDYYKMHRASDPPPVVGPKRKQTREISFSPWLAGVVIVALIAAAVYWIMSRQPTGTASTGATAPAAQPANGRSADDTITIPLQTYAAEDGSVAASTEEPPPSRDRQGLAADAATPASSAGEAEAFDSTVSAVELTFAFTGDCWTEVTDSNGRRLFFDLGRAGSIVRVSGVAPLRVLLGDRTNVSLQVDGIDYSIPLSDTRGNTARMTINRQ